jgi:hypothetical protein
MQYNYTSNIIPVKVYTLNNQINNIQGLLYKL